MIHKFVHHIEMVVSMVWESVSHSEMSARLPNSYSDPPCTSSAQVHMFAFPLPLCGHAALIRLRSGFVPLAKSNKLNLAVYVLCKICKVDVHQPALQTDTRAESEAEAVHMLAPYGVYHIQRAGFSRPFVNAVLPAPRCSLHLASTVSGERDSHEAFARQCFTSHYGPALIFTCHTLLLTFPLLFTIKARRPYHVWQRPAPPCNIFHLLLVCVALRSSSAYQPSFVSPSPSIPVSSYPRLVYVYACAYANVNVLALV
jgi:hypothetical protein